MSNSESIRAHGSSFQRVFWLVSNLLFSSLILLFLFWIVTSFFILDGMRSQEASTAHLLLVFDQPPSSKEIQGLVSTMEKVAGPGSVTSFQANNQSSPTERRNSKRILSVSVSLGQTPKGQTILLGDQIRSIQQIVKNDTSIKEIVFNPDWVARVDLLAGISGGMKKILAALLSFLSIGLGIYWTRWGIVLWNTLFSNRTHSSSNVQDKGDRQPLFHREKPQPGSFEKENRESFQTFQIPGVVRLVVGGIFGVISAGAALLLSWILRRFLYPEMVTPFARGSMVTLPFSNHIEFYFILGSGLIGILGGIFCTILPKYAEPEKGFYA